MVLYGPFSRLTLKILMVTTEIIADLLSELEHELDQLDLWQLTPPSAEQLNSRLPFAVDQLAPQQWLQWVFIPKMRELITQQAPLPVGFELSPYFSQEWHSPVYAALLLVIQRIDEACQ